MTYLCVRSEAKIILNDASYGNSIVAVMHIFRNAYVIYKITDIKYYILVLPFIFVIKQ
jgi:hypothetical protein